MKKMLPSTERHIKSFMGFLEGTGKALSTRESYRADLKTFHEFLREGMGPKSVPVEKLSLKDLERYAAYLGKKGFLTNTRRRKLLTVRRFLKYLNVRKKLKANVSARLPAPFKLERAPKSLPKFVELKDAIDGLSLRSPLDARNAILLRILLETGCRVSELTHLRVSQFTLTNGSSALEFIGQNPRSVPISQGLFEAIKNLNGKPDDFLFRGYNRFGPLGGAITPRGVEIMVRSYRKRFQMRALTPRLIRQVVILHWLRSGVTRAEIKSRLGLQSDYAFRVYEPLLARAQ